jgi:hypothetical protein
MPIVHPLELGAHTELELALRAHWQVMQADLVTSLGSRDSEKLEYRIPRPTAREEVAEKGMKMTTAPQRSRQCSIGSN